MDLPTVLAGPIVRRVEPRSVSIWVALSEPLPVTVLVWQNAQKATSEPGVVQTGDDPWASATADPLHVGQHFHVALVTVTNESPRLPMPPGTIHAYDVQLGDPGQPPLHDLRSLHYLEDEVGDADIDDRPPRLALGYARDQLPTFVTPAASHDELVLAHTSCRKTIGEGHDAMMYLDETIDATLGLPTRRPQQLFLTGDQIYADDVSLLLLRNLNQLGEQLFGRHEALPVDVPGTGLTDVTASLTEFPPERRTRLLRRQAKLTSGTTANHLMSFAEYCAMYLSAWSPDVWSALPSADEVYVANQSSIAALLTAREECAVRELRAQGALTPALQADPIEAWKFLSTRGKGDGSRFPTQERRTMVFRRGVPHAARVLANVATYMIFDDHEITDDWNLTQSWVNKVHGAVLGRTVLRNGLMAYALFQGWGNDPVQFGTGDARALLTHIGQIMPDLPSGPIPVIGEATAIDELLGLSGAQPKVSWNYTIEAAIHRSVVLDTRTRRAFAGRLSPPELLGTTLNKQIQTGPLAGGLETLVMVSAVPVLGPLLIDAIGQPARILVADFMAHANRVKDRLLDAPDDPCAEEHPLGLEEFDAESWARNEDALELLLERLASYEHTVLLSGDVHYAMSLVLDYWKKSSTDAAASRVIQLTASPARNTFKPLVESLIRADALGQRLERIGLPAVRFGWKDAAEPNVALPQGASVKPAIRARLQHDPVLVPGSGWPPGTTLAADPDWRWRLDLLRDPRTDLERPAALGTPPSPFPDADRSVDGYLRSAGRHAVAAQQHFDHIRQMVFPNNVGVVRFRTDVAGRRLVEHELVSEDPTDPTRTTADGPGTLHRVALAAAAEEPPDLVTDDG